MLENYIPQWSVGPAKLLLFTIGFYIFGKLFVKPLVSWLAGRKSETVANLVSKLAMYLTVIVGIGVGLTAGGYGNVMTALGTILAAGTVAIGFAMKDTISAVVAGFFILIDKPFEIGDWIEWNGKAGTVKDIRIRTTKIWTFDNELLTVPNSELVNNTIKNPVAGERLRVQLDIGIGYEDQIEHAKKVLEEIMGEIDGISKEKNPDVKLVGLGDSTVDLKARYWMEEPKRVEFVNTREDVLEKVKKRFDEEGINIPYPTQTIAGDSLKIEKE